MKKILKKISILFIFLWLIGIWFIISYNTSYNTNEKNTDYNQNELNQQDSDTLLDRVRLAENYLAQLELKNKKNELIIASLKQQAKKLLKSKNYRLNSKLDQDLIETELELSDKYPSQSFEETRRKLFTDIQDLSFYFNSEIENLNNQHDNFKTKIDFLKNNFQDRINVLISEMYNLSVSDNLGYWRRTESKALADLVIKEFDDLQNPTDCKNKKKIVCDLNKSCGFGCQMHHVMYCFITAYFTKRTLILESSGWRYNSEGYEAYFKPLSKTCKTTNENIIDWEGSLSESAQAIRMPPIDEITDKPEFFPLTVPKKYYNSLTRFHGDPFVWWAGQILSYLMRFNLKFEKMVNKIRENLKFSTPCVGVHVRRTDKVGTEASYHSLDEYMRHVKAFYDLYDFKYSIISKRNVYLATDDLSVMNEAKSNYKDFNFIMDEQNAKTASVNQRYSPESAQGVILDIHFLSQCDYLVCTLSSQVCRMAFELMQARYPDASWRFKSLDDVYYFGGQIKHNVIAVYDHIPQNEQEIEIKKGDLIGLAGNHWNGYSKGKNLRTEKEGLFPSYKVKNVVEFY